MTGGSLFYVEKWLRSLFYGVIFRRYTDFVVFILMLSQLGNKCNLAYEENNFDFLIMDYNSLNEPWCPRINPMLTWWFEFYTGAIIQNIIFTCFPFCNFSFIWTVAILISFGFLIYAVSKEFIEYHSLPTITKSEYLFSSKMNFPAVTICSTSPMSKTRAITNARRDNYWKSCSVVMDQAKPINWSEPEYSKEGYFEPRTEKEVFNEAVQVEDLLISCAFEGKPLDCSEEFQPVITDVGVCYVFNKDGKFSTTLSSPAENLILFVNVNEDDMTWSLQSGTGIMVSCVHSFVLNSALSTEYNASC